ncbi:putative bifunctional diguanylate cyclase/phosphodiesterase [Nitrosomonas ureae]|uniref:Diguanylate cyclase (GGDEF)-like protein n=1 Tax=Nitrosomonas ureae TaxID=44577 RepID=A0A2T5I2E2_9PROT|nr:EAL domain-containing protein [Nitrosomonas ureae]PTQ78014.1 diguanylate cyclase (GGDEF)-like protein [Nitrosomonas ureae]
MAKRAQEISLLGGLIFIGLTVATGISVYYVMLQQPEYILKLQTLAQNNVMVIEKKINEAILDTQSQINRPFLIQSLQQLDNNNELITIGYNLHESIKNDLEESNFTGISLFNSNGKQVLSVGQFSSKIDAIIPVNTSKARVFLLWDNGFILRTDLNIIDLKGKFIGSILSERKLPQLTNMFLKPEKIGKTGQLVLCAPWGTVNKEMVCFLTSLSNKYTVEFKHLPRIVSDESLPMDYALKNRSGITIGMKDYRSIPIAGAYSPINMYDLGLVLKIDEEELFKPITSKLGPVALSMAVLIIVGIFLLYWLVRPLVQKLIKSEQELTKRISENACLYAIRKNLLSSSSTNEVCHQIIDQLTKAMKFPQITEIKIELNGQEFLSRNYTRSLFHGLHSEIKIKGVSSGSLQVYYSKNLPFLIPQEQNLINLIADDLGRWWELIKAEQYITHSATHDELTGLPNRRLLQDRITQVLAQGIRNDSQTAVLFIDLDNFKNINDSLGHDMGDLLLKEVAARLKSCIRSEDTVARQGGDEFIVILCNIHNAQKASLVAQKILDILISPINLNKKEMHIGCSIGIALSPEDGINADELLKNSDTAMYHAKESGRNNYQFFTPKMNQLIAERGELVTELHNALKRDELLLHFQPVVRMPDRKIIGLEVLLRWKHPTIGMISPLKFIPLAEETGIIVQIGEWVIRSVCIQIKAWQKKGFEVPRVAINLSIRQFQHKTLVADISRILDETGVDAKYMTLEITESMLAQNIEDMKITLNKLSAMQMNISLDDFGTGYSNLSYLKGFSINTLKIDRSFIQDIVTDPNDAAITVAIIAMARSLNMEIIAEGLETEEQLDFLSKQGCDYFQGYYFSKPLSIKNITNTLIRENSFNKDL